MDNVTSGSAFTLPPKEPSLLGHLLASIGPQLTSIAILAALLLASRFYREDDPYNLKSIDRLPRSRIMDAYQSGSVWRFFVPRLTPYLDAAYHKYSRNGKPFRIWFIAIRTWVYVLPPKYLEKIKNQSQSALNLRAVIHMAFPGLLDNFVAQVASKLVNVYLSEIDPLLQSRTEHLLDRDIGAPKQWKSVNANKLSHDLVDHVSGRLVFGENLVDNTAFREPMTRYSHRLVAHGLLGRRFNIWPLSPLFARYLQWQLERDLAIVARFVGDEVSKRRQQQQQDPNGKKPFDCIQWAMEQDIPEHQKTPEAIAQRLAFATSGMISTPPGTLLSFFFDIASQKSFVDEIRTEIAQVLKEDGKGWVETSIAKMKKLESFCQESIRTSSSLAPLTGWRLVTSDSFRFDDSLTLPKGSIITFPTRHMRMSPDTFESPDNFDGHRFMKIKEEQGGKDDLASDAIKHRSLLFGYGRQACPGRFYAQRMMKVIIGVMISRYDIRYAGGDRERPESWDIEPFLIGDTTVDLELKVRG